MEDEIPDEGQCRLCLKEHVPDPVNIFDSLPDGNYSEQIAEMFQIQVLPRLTRVFITRVLYRRINKSKEYLHIL